MKKQTLYQIQLNPSILVKDLKFTKSEFAKLYKSDFNKLVSNDSNYLQLSTFSVQNFLKESYWKDIEIINKTTTRRKSRSTVEEKYGFYGRVLQNFNLNRSNTVYMILIFG